MRPRAPSTQNSAGSAMLVKGPEPAGAVDWEEQRADTAPVAVRPAVAMAPLLLPLALLLLGAAIGLPFTLNAQVAWERLLGLLAAGVLALGALAGLRRTPDQRLAPILLVVAVAAILGGLWVIAASGPDVFRGPLGDPLRGLFGPVFGRVVLTDPWELTNTRFVVGYNGLADLCLLAGFASAAGLAMRPGKMVAGSAGALLVASLVLLVGTGSRGGLVGLVAGLWVVSLLVWRRGWLLALAGTPVAVGMAALGVLDKGFDATSTAGRLAFWGDYLRLLSEYPLTGVGLGVDTAHRVVLFHEVNPDPDRIYYAHNTFVQAYLEQGPLGAMGMLILPALVLLGAVLARHYPPSLGRRALLGAGVGLTAALEAHGLTDQVLTTNVGTALLLLGVVAVLGALGPRAQAALAAWTRRLGLGLATIGVMVLFGLLLLPSGRAQALLNLGGLQLDQAVLRAPPGIDRQALGEAESTLTVALAQDSGHPAILRDLARARFARYDTAGALDALEQADNSPRIDAFDMLQIAHLYRDLGFVEEAYKWARRAYETSGRPPPDPVMLVYRQATAKDDFRVRTLAEQGEAAMRARAFDEALSLFEQALAFAPDNPYLQDRVGAAQRGVQRQHVSEGRQTR